MIRTSAGLLLFALALPSCQRRPEAEQTKACTAPRTYWQQPHFTGGLETLVGQVSLDHRSQVYYAGKPVSLDQLSARLNAANKVTNPDLIILLDTEMGADCAILDSVRNRIDRAMNCKTSQRCAEGSRTVWNALPVPPGTPPS